MRDTTLPTWRIAAVTVATVLALPANCQEPLRNEKKATSEMRVFTSTDGAFQVSYPADFQVCTRGKMGPCSGSYIPLCDQDSPVCIVYPGKEFAGSNLSAAAFEAGEVTSEREAMTADVCVTPFPSTSPGAEGIPGFLISAEHPAEMIGGVLFVHGVSADAAMSHWRSVNIYLAFHKGRCFALRVSETGIDPGVTDPPTPTLTPAQRKKLEGTMSQILHSFRFLK
jgi:hypothetical protein